METTEVDLFLKARSQFRLERRLNLTAVAFALALLTASLILKGSYHTVAISLAYGSLIGLFVYCIGWPRFSGLRVTPSDLLNVIESQISRDPHALSYMLQRKSLG